MTATTINTKTAPTAEAIQEALAFLRNLSEKKTSEENAEGSEKTDSVFNSDIFKTIEAALKSAAEAKAVSENGEEASEDEDETIHKKKQAAFTASQDTDEDEEDDDDEDGTDDTDDDDDDDNYEEEDNDDGWGIGDVLAIGAGVALGAAVVYGGIKLGKAIFSD